MILFHRRGNDLYLYASNCFPVAPRRAEKLFTRMQKFWHRCYIASACLHCTVRWTHVQVPGVPTGGIWHKASDNRFWIVLVPGKLWAHDNECVFGVYLSGRSILNAILHGRGCWFLIISLPVSVDSNGLLYQRHIPFWNSWQLCLFAPSSPASPPHIIHSLEKKKEK